MKNAVPKIDKKRRKQLTEDVAKLEAEMEQKHKEELEQLKQTSKESKVGEVMFLFVYLWKQLPLLLHCLLYKIIKSAGKKSLSHAHAITFHWYFSNQVYMVVCFLRKAIKENYCPKDELIDKMD